MLNICYFGTYESNYSRNKIIIEGLRRNGVEVSECNYPLWEGKEHKSGLKFLSKIKLLLSALKGYSILTYKYFKLKEDVIIIGYPGQFDAIFVKLLSKFKKKFIVFDAYLSLYDSMVNDRKVIGKDSLYAKFLYSVDKYSCKFSNKVLLDTDAHIRYFCKMFNIPQKKFHKVWIGANDDIFHPLEENKNEKFTVIFHGKFIPLQGVPYIIEAGKYLKDVNIKIIGDGQTRKEMERLTKVLGLNNIEFCGFLPYSELPKELAKADVGLGVFGDTEKARRVIPNKAYEIMAMKLPLITGDSEASREGLKDKENCLLCDMANPKAIADAIDCLQKDRELREKIAKEGYKLYNKEFSPKEIGKSVKKMIENEIK